MSVATVPLPDPSDVDAVSPTAEEVADISRLVVAASAPGGVPSPLQRALVDALFAAMTGHPAMVPASEQTPLDELAQVLARRNEAFRTRILQVAVLAALILRPMPPEVGERVGRLAGILGVHDDMLTVARHMSAGSLGLVAIDFERNGYTATWTPTDATALHTSGELADAWAAGPRPRAGGPLAGTRKVP